MKRFIYVFLMVLILGFGVLDAMAEDTTTPPEGYVPTSTDVEINALSNVLIIQDAAPWGSTANEDILTANGIPYSVINSSAIAGTDFSPFDKIIIASDQPTSFYNTYMANKTKFDDYVFNGGMLEWHTAAWGWNGGDASGVILPGGVGIVDSYQYSNYVADPSHDLVQGVPNPFSGTYASHSFLSNIGSANVITTTGNTPGGQPTLIEYLYGAGCVIASGQTLEYAYPRGQAGGIILQNMIPYSCLPPDLIISNLIAKVRTYGTQMIRGVLVNYTVTNQGDGDANPSCLDFYLSRDTVLDGGDVYVGTENIPSLGAGGSYNGAKGYNLPFSKWQSASGTWRVIGVADACDDNAESDETNNQLAVVAGIVVK